MNKNTIYYRFLSEKKKYCINFDTTEISIGDIKREIARRRNMEKAPEKYDLLFYDESNAEIRDESYKVEPLKLLIIKRIPSYKLSAQFVEMVHDPSDIVLMKGNEYNYAHKTQIAFVNNAEPLEKICSKITMQQLEDKFRCQLCKRKEEDGYVYHPVITLCCSGCACDVCVNANLEQCVLCKGTYAGTIPNKAEFELKEKLYEIMNKIKEATLQLQLQSYQSAVSNQNVKADSNNPSLSTALPQGGNHQVNPQGMTQISMRPNFALTPKESNPLANVQLNPSYVLFEKARFFIIKSSNKENLEISQKYSEWATTLNNQKKLNEAFHSNNVILIFSASRTGCFQGYAIMTTFIGDKVSNIWQNENNVKLGGSFKVIWLSCCEMPFTRVKHLANPLNNHEQITKSRDTQELPKEIGYELCTLCYEQEKAEINLKPMKVLTPEVINSISAEIKANRDKQLQRPNPAMMRMPAMMNPSFYPFMMGTNYLYPYYPMMPQAQGQPGQMPVMPAMPNMPNMQPTMLNLTPQAVSSHEKKRERSRDNSEKSKSSHSSSRKSRN